ncbi:MAG: Crp/Fnr family transcriptional regulator [Bacteroidetes bacterium]|nr:Crp/Fnr family transcriptional regulator [Bacteroidota bacterium]
MLLQKIDLSQFFRKLNKILYFIMSLSIEKYYFKPISIIEGLSPEHANFLIRKMQRLEIKKGKILFKEGAYPRGVFILRKGKVKIFQTNKEGKEQIMYFYKKGEVFGYRPILSNETNPVSAQTLEDCVVSFIPKNSFIQILNSSVFLSNKLLANLAFEFTVWVNKVSVFTQQPVKERVALSLLILEEKYRLENSSKLATINLSRDDIASYVGTAKETLVRVLKEFKEKKYIESKGRRITILSLKGLEKIIN